MAAADRPTVPRVGDTLTTAEQLDALPSLAIVIDANDEVQQRHGHLTTERGDYSAWLGVMPPTCKPSPDVALPVTVLYVPGEQAREGVGTGAGEGDDPASTEATSWVTRSTDCPEAPAQAHPRPSVTDNARAACGCDLSVGPNALHIVDGHDDAAGRAETTTATDEDAAQVITDYLATYTLPANYTYPDNPHETNWSVAKRCGPLIAKALADAGLLATARTRPTETATEWAVRWGNGHIDLNDDGDEPWTEQSAREFLVDCAPGTVLVRREVTAWTEADQ